jgi:hypothetical protein
MLEGQQAPTFNVLASHLQEHFEILHGSLQQVFVLLEQHCQLQLQVLLQQQELCTVLPRCMMRCVPASGAAVDAYY